MFVIISKLISLAFTYKWVLRSRRESFHKSNKWKKTKTALKELKCRSKLEVCYSEIRSARASVPTSSSQVKVVAGYKSRSVLLYGGTAREFTDAADFRTTNRGWAIIPHYTRRTLPLTIITSGQATTSHAIFN